MAESGAFVRENSTMRITVIRGSKDQATDRQTYEIADGAGMSVSNVLQFINRHYDGGLAYYLSCRRGLCAACAVEVNGKNRMACTVEAEDGMVIGPVQKHPWIKDTVVHLGVSEDATFDLANCVFRSSDVSR